jgi:hypothetical protein
MVELALPLIPLLPHALRFRPFPLDRPRDPEMKRRPGVTYRDNTSEYSFDTFVCKRHRVQAPMLPGAV